jgi:hypothetical protein
MVIAGLVGLAILVVLTALLLNREDPQPEMVEPEPVEEPEEVEPEPPEPVEGTAELEDVRNLSVTGTRLVQPGSDADEAIPPDEDAIEALVEDLTAWLDEHLTQLQDGDEGLVRQASLAGDEAIGDLAGPADIVEQAGYRFLVGARGEPEWAEVTVEVAREDGSSRAARLVFDADRELLAVEGDE